MGVKKQMGNNHVSKINDNFQKNLIGCGLGAFFPSFFSCLSFSRSSLSLPILPPFCSFFFGLGVEIREEKKGGEKARQ